MNTKPKVNIDFAINTRGQLVQYFVNPFNACHGYIIDGVKELPGFYFHFCNKCKFTFLENTHKS